MASGGRALLGLRWITDDGKAAARRSAYLVADMTTGPWPDLTLRVAYSG